MKNVMYVSVTAYYCPSEIRLGKKSNFTEAFSVKKGELERKNQVSPNALTKPDYPWTPSA